MRANPGLLPNSNDWAARKGCRTRRERSIRSDQWDNASPSPGVGESHSVEQRTGGLGLSQIRYRAYSSLREEPHAERAPPKNGSRSRALERDQSGSADARK